MDYVHTLRAHITYENVTFFPKTTQLLSEKEFEVLEAEFAKWEEKVGGDSLKKGEEDLRALANLLAG